MVIQDIVSLDLMILILILRKFKMKGAKKYRFFKIKKKNKNLKESHKIGKQKFTELINYFY